MEFRIPHPLKTEHEELHAALVKATRARGQIAGAAKAVAKILHPHFVNEKEYALPPPTLRPHLVRREFHGRNERCALDDRQNANGFSSVASGTQSHRNGT
jgi:hypothetical protein